MITASRNNEPTTADNSLCDIGPMRPKGADQVVS